MAPYFTPARFILASALLISACTGGQQSRLETADTTVHTDTASTADTLPRAPVATPAAGPLNSLRDIRAAYTAITAQLERGELDSVSFKYNCNNERSGTVSYFSYRGSLKLVVHRYSEYSHFSATDRYFVQDSTLFFAYLNPVSWSFDSGPQGSTKDQVTERRIYLLDEKPAECLEKKFTIRSAATDNPRPEDVPNKRVDCPAASSVLAPYRLLLAYRNKPVPGCLEK